MDASANNITYQFHTELNPQVWDGNSLKPEIKDKLLEIAEAFLDSLEVEIDIEDITLTGSLANYNYTKYSDFDVHIITNYKNYGEDVDLITDYFKAKKTLWNTTHDITVKGYDVEMYVQDSTPPHYSTGVYSLKNDEWLVKPKPTKEKKDIDVQQVKLKMQSMLDIINFALSPNCDEECAEKAKEKFMELRKVGLEKGGELSPENLAFKELRRSGDIERLIQGVIVKKDKSLSLDSIQKENLSFKNFMGINKKRGPRHQSLTAGINKIGNSEPGKSISIVADMHRKKKTDTVPVHNLKKKGTGGAPITNDRANQIIAQYGLDINKIKSGQPRQLSTSGISIGFDPLTNTFYLRK